MTHAFNDFVKRISKPLIFRLFMLRNLPSALLAGLRIVRVNEENATVSVRYKWFNKNPFGSVYFAVLSMAAEISTGILCIGYLYKKSPALSMLVVKVEGDFFKKATGTILFTCEDGAAIKNAVEQAITTGDGATIKCLTTGKNETGETVATFNFTWSFKVKSKR